MIDLRMDVKGDGEHNRLKIDWKSAVADAGFFHVDGNRLAAASETVRARLQDVVDAAHEGRPYENALLALAREGAVLREELFNGEAGDEEDAYAVKTWFEELGTATLHVTVDRRIYIPWGLVFDGEPEELIENPSQAKSGFWCMKYRLSTLYYRILDRVVSKPSRADKARILSLVHAEAWAAAKTKVDGAAGSIAALPFEDPAQFIFSRADFDKSWRRDKRSLDTDVLYFFGHSSGAALELSRDDIIEMDTFPRILRRSPPQPHPACMIFLNGCQTAIGEDLQGGFLEATGSAGYCGFIGTEAKAPDDFALRFGRDFLCGMLQEGKSAIEVMDMLRYRHWPMSLIYNLSCHPNFRFDPASAPAAGSEASGTVPR